MLCPLSARRLQVNCKPRVRKVSAPFVKSQKCIQANLLQHLLLENLRLRFAQGLQGFRKMVDDNCDPIRQQLSNFWLAFFNMVEERKRELNRNQSTAVCCALASMTTGRFVSNKASPLFDVALNREELKERIAVIPIYTVTNNKNDIILITSEEQGASHQVGLLFLEERDALQLIDKLKKENPSMGKSSKVTRVGLDDVYDLLTNRRYLIDLEKVIFRFVPDMKQIAYAMEVFHNAGAPSKSITGVPVFQAEGLSVASPTAKGTPLFLNKKDMELALKTAAENKVEKAMNEYDKERQMLLIEEQKNKTKAEKASNKKQAQKYLKIAEKANAKYEELGKKMESINSNIKDPRVEVSSLEEVISKMERDAQGDWDNVIFVRSGLILEQAMAKSELANAK